MTLIPAPTTIFRRLVVMTMALLILAFTSAEVRAGVMVRMAEEQGVGRFYEDKVHRVDADVQRLAQLQQRRHPVDVPLHLDQPTRLSAHRLHLGRPERPIAARAPPHLPRAPPRHA